MRSVAVAGPFSLEHALDCGQAFRWRRDGGHYRGVVGGRLIVLGKKEGALEYEMSPPADGSLVSSYFRLDDDYAHIVSAISRDGNVKGAVDAYPGLRLLRQEPWECLTSYICSAWSNVERIKGTIDALCRAFGDRIECVEEAYAFPSPEALASASIPALMECGLGYRAKYVKGTAEAVESGRVDLESLKCADYGEAKKELLSLPGVGEKVADCTLLFSLDRLEAFPVDVWVRRVMQQLYFGGRDVKDAGIKQFAAKRFGAYAGYAQQFLYHYARSGKCELR